MVAEFQIRIHPASEGRITNVDAARRLAAETPSAFRKSQDVLVAAKRYMKGPGLFRSERSLIQNLQKEIYGLRRALMSDKYRPDLHRAPTQLLFAYMSEFSDAFPNWQGEYSKLNEFIPLCLDGF